MKAQLELVKTRLELVRIFNAASSFSKILKIQKYYQNEPKFIKMNLNLMVFIQEITYLK